jgi:hypothetical protein
MSLAVAVLVAAVFATFGFPFNHLQAWYSWGRWRTQGIIIIYLALAGVGGGGIGWLVGTLTMAQLTSNEALNGALYGISGALTVRADFRSRRKSPAETKDAASIITIGIEWTRNALDSIMVRAIREWVRKRTLVELNDLAYASWGEMKLKLSPQQQRTQISLITPALERLMQGSEAEKRESRALLEAYVKTHYQQERLPKPPVNPW